MEILLISIALIWLIAATVTDIKTTEIPNWLNYSLMIFAVVSYSLISYSKYQMGALIFLILALLALLISLSKIYYDSNDEKTSGKIRGLIAILITSTLFICISIISNLITPLFYSIIALLAFTAIGYLMYYSRQWGGGDARLLAAIGASFPVYPSILKEIFSPKFQAPYFPVTILINIVIFGAVYGLIFLIITIIKNKKAFLDEFKKANSKHKKIRNMSLTASLILIVLGIFMPGIFQIRVVTISLGITIIIFFYLFIMIKASEKSSMFIKIPVEKLREGDWITKEIRMNNKLIYAPKAAGVSKEEIVKIKKHLKEIEIKSGIAFMPAFLIAIIISLILGNPILWLF